MPRSTTSSPNIRLSDTQLIALTKATQREDCAIVLSDRLTGSAAKRFVDALIEKGLAREIRAKPGMPIARRDQQGAFALVITKAGRAAINVGDDEARRAAPSRSSKGGGGKQPSAPKRPAAGGSGKTDKVSKEPSKKPANASAAGKGTPREGSKLATVIGLLSRPSGAALEELIEATSWLPHTTRAALTGLRKKDFVLERTRAEGVTSYRISSAPEPGSKKVGVGKSGAKSSESTGEAAAA